MSTPLTLDTTHGNDGEVVLIVKGEIDQSNIDEFSRALSAARAQVAGSGATFTVDLNAVDYLDSAAINVLYANADHITIVASPLLMRILSVSGISELVSVRTSPGT